MLVDSRSLRRVDLAGARLEGVGEHAEGAVEHRAHQRAENAALELVVDEEIDRTAAVGGLLETPAIVEIFERAVDIFDVDERALPC